MQVGAVINGCRGCQGGGGSDEWNSLIEQAFGFNLSSTGPWYLNVACGVAVANSPTGNVGTSLLMPFDGELLRVDMRSYISDYGSSTLDAYVDGSLIDSDTQLLNTGGYVTFTFAGVTFVRGEHVRLRITTSLVGAGVSASMVFQPS